MSSNVPLAAGPATKMGHVTHVKLDGLVLQQEGVPVLSATAENAMNNLAPHVKKDSRRMRVVTA